MEVIHFCLVRIELNPNLGPPSGEVGEESFQFRMIFDNDGNIVNINECVREKFKTCTIESSSATVVLRCRLVGGVYVGMMKSRDGVLSTGHLGWESLPWSANLSASLFPRMSTWDGTLINLMEPVCALRVSRRSSQRGTLETGPLLPIHPLSFHRRAAPVAPRKTYSLSVQIATLPKERICNARTTARSSAVLFVCRKCTVCSYPHMCSMIASEPYLTPCTIQHEQDQCFLSLNAVTRRSTTRMFHCRWHG